MSVNAPGMVSAKKTTVTKVPITEAIKFMDIRQHEMPIDQTEEPNVQELKQVTKLDIVRVVSLA